MSQATKKVLSPSELLAAAAALAAGTHAYGDVVIFINPSEGDTGHFDWDWFDGGSFPETPSQWLDITRPSTDQGGGLGPSSVGLLFYGNSGASAVYTTGGAMLAFVHPEEGIMTASLPSGAAIDGQLDFLSTTAHIRSDNYFGWVYTAFSDGLPSYMAVRFADIDGYHYGWIGVVRNYWDFDAFAWGYETEPGVPIVAGIPAPGTLAALAFGAVVTRRGRKREES